MTITLHNPTRTIPLIKDKVFSDCNFRDVSRELAIDLISHAGLLKTVTKLGQCFEKLTKDFFCYHNLRMLCDKEIKEYKKVFLRGLCVEISLVIINRFLGRNEKE